MKIYLIGFMGSGKTHWGQLLAQTLQLPFIDLDRVITDSEHRSISDIFSEKGEEYFRYKEKEVLEDVTAENEHFVLSAGGGTPCFFNNIEFMKKSGKVVWLNSSVDILQQRLMSERASRPMISKVKEADLRSFIIRKLGERKMYYEQAHLIVAEEGIALDRLLKLLLQDE